MDCKKQRFGRRLREGVCRSRLLDAAQNLTDNCGRDAERLEGGDGIYLAARLTNIF